MNQTGNLSFVVTFFIIAVGLTFLFIVIVPALQTYNTEMFRASEPIRTLAANQAALIEDPTTKAEFEEISTNQANVASTAQDILGTLFQWSWVIILFVSAIIIFLFSRSLVERQTGVL